VAQLVLKTVSTHREGVTAFSDLQDLLVSQGPLDRAVIDHPSAGNSHDVKLFPLNLVFDDVGHNVSGVAPVGHNSDTVGPFGQVIAKVQTAVAVPVKEIDFRWSLDQHRFIHHGHRALLVTDENVDGSLFQELSSNVSDFLSILKHQTTSALFLTR
jgi:hypothetical protein